MPISIQPPQPAPQIRLPSASSDDDYDGLDSDGDIDMEATARSSKRPRRSIITPGEVVTSDPQWMRGHGTYIPPTTTTITSTLAGTLLKTNKLLSITPLRARYNPSVGDLVVGRIAEVQQRRWRVDVAAPLLAALPLSAVNLPGGIQRKRTSIDELNIRAFLSEGDVVVAEVQTVYQDGGAGLHTRSARFGKLRNGYFMALSGAGGGSTKKGGVVRSTRQVFTLTTSRGGEIDVVLGVNGYIWISKHIEPAKEVGITRLEESAPMDIYSSQNEDVPPETRREIARVAGLVNALVERGVRVDQEMVVRAYQALEEVDSLGMEDVDDGEGGDYLGGEKGRRIVEVAVGMA